jgi:nucleotide-binding universal stress UspA family protein
MDSRAEEVGTMQSQTKNILIGVDASDYTFEAVRYVGKVMPAEKTRIKLLHVMNPMPDSFYDLGLLPAFRHEEMGLRAWEAQQRNIMEAFMDRAWQLLVSMGYSSEKISATIRKREAGVARDIAAEARRGYDALVVGRKGTSALEELVLGSIANKLVSYLAQPPTWIVGGHPSPHKILIAMDSSEYARRALEYIFELFGRDHPELMLLHVTRGQDLTRPSLAGDFLTANWLNKVREEFKKAEQVMHLIFADCVSYLEQHGADSARIRTKIIPGVYSRAAAIYGEAVEGGYGTIVVGRRGLSRVDEFLMGRVSNKVLQLSEGKAVWIVQ